MNRVGQLLSKHVVFLIFLALSVTGAVITRYYPAASHYYWLVMMLVFGGLSIASEFYRASSLTLQRTVLIQQGMHWLGGLFVAIIVNLYYHSGRIFTEETGLIMLLTLALTVFLEGAQRGWRYCFTGFFLGLLAISAAYLDNYLWQLALLAVLGGVVSQQFKSDYNVNASV